MKSPFPPPESESAWLTAADGQRLAAQWFRPLSDPHGVVLIAPAMQSLYQRFATWLAEQGFLALTFDYRGIGRSLDRPLREVEVDVVGWARLDASAALETALEPGLLTWIGHSLGGQILPFVRGRREPARYRKIPPVNPTGPDPSQPPPLLPSAATGIRRNFPVPPPFRSPASHNLQGKPSASKQKTPAPEGGRCNRALQPELVLHLDPEFLSRARDRQASVVDAGHPIAIHILSARDDAGLVGHREQRFHARVRAHDAA